MNWFSGSIAEAVALSKAKNAIFVVYVEGNDELSEKLRKFINDERIKRKLESDCFVAVRVEGGSEAYMQFAQIYQLVPLPSMFFIGKNGTPIEIATGVVNSIDELDSKIERVLTVVGLKIDEKRNAGASSASVANASANFISGEQAASSGSDIVCEGGVCYRKTDKTEEPKEEAKQKPEAEASKSTDVVFENKKESNPEPKEKSKPETKEKSNAETKEKSNAETKEKSKPEPKEKSKPETKEESKPEPKEKSKPEPKEKSKPEPKEKSKPEPKEESKSEPKEESKSELKEDSNSHSKGRSGDDQPDEITEKVDRAKKLLEEKRKEKEAEEARLEHEKEIRRRKEGQEMQTLKKWQHEHELKELKDSIRKEKLEEQAARQRILEKIASDKAERAQKFGQISPQKPDQATPKPVPLQRSNQENFENSRIQFKKPDGESEMHTFKSADTFGIVRNYVKGTLLQGTGIREFSLATAFPRKEFTSEDDSKTLCELSLCPTAVLLVITRTNTGPAAVVARSGGVVNIFNSIFWGLLAPFFAALNYIKGFFGGQKPSTSGSSSTGAQKRASDNAVDHQDLAKKRSLDRFAGNGIVNDFPSTSSDPKVGGNPIPYRRIGGSNVHRLRDQRDSDDENNTWNGNSTQQQ